MRVQITPADERWLKSIGVADDGEMPAPVVAMDMYLAVVRAAEFATNSEFRQRKAKRRLWRRYCGLRRSRTKWQFASAVMGVWWAVWLIGQVTERWNNILNW